MTTTEKAKLISTDSSLAFFKLVTTKEANDIFLETKEKMFPKDANFIYTTKLNTKATKNALYDMLSKKLI